MALIAGTTVGARPAGLAARQLASRARRRVAADPAHIRELDLDLT